ncbi:hypothetical protein [Polaromonas sp. LjRoot131]|uniref:hypothetical protein n=1 Tax=Polaromonas sp. LjRoot131 TaxID=3342262 RepID=UPI003ECF2D5B
MPAVLTTRSPLPESIPLENAGHADSAAREHRYNSLVARMAAYQQGSGPAPAKAEFEQWKEDVAYSLAMRRLLADATPRH